MLMPELHRTSVISDLVILHLYDSYWYLTKITKTKDIEFDLKADATMSKRNPCCSILTYNEEGLLTFAIFLSIPFA